MTDLNLVYSFNGWGVTVVDSMDTMYLMGLHKEFSDAVEYVSTMTFDLKGVCTSTAVLYDNAYIALGSIRPFL